MQSVKSDKTQKKEVPYLTAADMMELKKAVEKAREEVKRHPEKYTDCS